PTLYVSNSFHQYKGAVISTYTTIIRMNFRWSVPALRRRFIRLRSFGPKYKPLSSSHPETGCPQNSLHHTYPCVQLSLFSQEFIGLRIPRIACSHPRTSKLLIFSIIILLF